MMSAGSVFVEIDLDYTRFERNQQKLIQSATTTSLSIEKNFQNIGVKSDAIFAAMRQSAVNSLEAIKAKSTSTGNEIARAQAAVAEQLRRINEEQYGRNTSLLEKYKTQVLAASAAIGYALYSMGKAAIVLGGQLDDASKKFGVAGSELSALQYVAKLSGVEFEGVGNSLKFLSKSIAESEKPSSDAAMAFQAMGISVKDTAGNLKATNDVYMEIADAFSKMKDGANKTALALLIFGRAGSDILPIFDEGAEGIKRMKEEAVRMGATLTDEQIKKLDSYGDAIDRIKMGAKATAGALMVDMVEGMKSWWESVEKYGPAIERFYASAFGGGVSDKSKGIKSGKIADILVPNPEPGPKAEAPNVAAMLEAKKLKDKLAADYLKDRAKILAEEGKLIHDALMDEMGMTQEYHDTLRKLDDESWEEEKKIAAAIVELDRKRYAEEGAIYMEALAAEMGATQEYLDTVREMKEAEFKAWLEMHDPAAMADFYDSIIGYEEEAYRRKLELINKEKEARIAAGIDAVAADKKAQQDILNARMVKFDNETTGMRMILSDTQSMFDSMSMMYDRESKEFKALQTMKQAAHTAELGMNVARAASALSTAMALNAANASTATSGAAASVAAQGQVPIAGFALAASMAAFMASVLATAGIAFGGGSVSAGGGMAGAGGYQYSDITLGAEAGTQSEALTNMVNLLQETYDLENRELTGIHKSVEHLAYGVEQVVTRAFQTGGFTAARFPRPYGANPWWTVTSSGLEYGPASAGSLMSGQQMGVSERANWGVPSNPNQWSTWQNTSDTIRSSITEVFKSMSELIVDLTRELGGDVTAAMNYVFQGGFIDLSGKNADEINAAINDYLANVGTQAIRAIFGTTLDQFQRLGESMLETAARLVVDLAVVRNTLEITRHSFAGTSQEMIVFTEDLVRLAEGLDNLREITATYYDKFYTDEEKTARLMGQLSSALGEMGMTLPDARQGYRNLVEGIDLSTAAGREHYIALLELAGAADEYYSALEDVGGSMGDMTKALKDQVRMITDWISDLSRSSLAPVQSMEGWRLEYERQKALASASGATTQDVSGFLNYAKEYLEFMRTYGGDYQALYNSVVGDVADIGEMKNTALMQLDAITAADNAARLAAARQLAATYDVMGRTAPAFAGGGLTSGPSLAGEAGREWVVPTYEPQRSNFLQNAPPEFWENMRGGGVSQGSGGDITVRVPVYLDGKVVADVVAKHIPRSANLSEAIRRVN